MATINYSDKTLKTWGKNFSALIKEYAKVKGLAPHFGTGNEKTHAINEGTLPLVTCDKCATCEGGCGHSCYALRCAIGRPNVRNCYALNTVLRRRDAVEYYTRAFATARATGALLRLNESGDFENVSQFTAACHVARAYPTVRVITYTHRREIAKLIKTAPKNMSIHYSAWTSCENQTWARKNRVPFAAVAQEPQTIKNAAFCPAQARAALNEKRIAEGLDPLPAWTCAACAAANIGCASKKNIVFKMH